MLPKIRNEPRRLAQANPHGPRDGWRSVQPSRPSGPHTNPETVSGAEMLAPESCATASVAQHLSHAGVDDDRAAAAVGSESSNSGAPTVSIAMRSSSRVAEGRARDGTESTNPAASSLPPSASAAADASAGHAVPAAAPPNLPAPVTRGELEERASLMFIVGNTSPVASGRPVLLQEATKELVQLAWEVVHTLIQHEGAELSSSFGNFDKLVGLGWLLGDVVQGRLVPGPDALAIGRKAGKLAPGLKADFAAPSRRAGKRKYRPGSDGDEQRARDLADAAEQERATRRSPVALPFPAAPPPPPVASKRKRVTAEPSPAPESMPADPNPPPRPDGLRAAAAQAERTLALAEGALSRAKRTAAQERAHYEASLTTAKRIGKRVSKRETTTDELWAQLMGEMAAAAARWAEADRAIGPAEAAFRTAALEAKEARIDAEEAEAARTRERRRCQEEAAAREMDGERGGTAAARRSAVRIHHPWRRVRAREGGGPASHTDTVWHHPSPV